MSTENVLNDREQAILKAVAAAMIPADADMELPSAGDDAIFADIMQSLGRDHAAIKTILHELDGRAAGDVRLLESAAQGTVLFDFKHANKASSAILERVVAQCYYRDPRVLKAIGIAAQPPYPKGYELVPAQSDWSLLEPVKARGVMYREVPDTGSA